MLVELGTSYRKGNPETYCVAVGRVQADGKKEFRGRAFIGTCDIIAQTDEAGRHTHVTLEAWYARADLVAALKKGQIAAAYGVLRRESGEQTEFLNLRTELLLTEGGFAELVRAQALLERIEALEREAQERSWDMLRREKAAAAALERVAGWSNEQVGRFTKQLAVAREELSAMNSSFIPGGEALPDELERPLSEQEVFDDDFQGAAIGGL